MVRASQRHSARGGDGGRLTQLRDAEAAIGTFGQLLERFPATSWGDEVTYLQARAHAMAGHCAVAAQLYRRTVEREGGGREDATSQLQRLGCA